MGEWMTQVPVKLSPETVERLDLLRAAYPFKPGRSTVIRELVEEGLRLIAEGIMQFRAQAINRVPSVQSIPSTPNEFPSAVESPETLLGKKPPVRVQVKVGANRRREFRSVSQRRAVGAGVRLAYMPHFPGKVSPIKSNSYVSARVA